MPRKKEGEAEPQLAVAMFDLAEWVLKCTNRWPKNHRVTLGDRLDGCVLELVSQVQLPGRCPRGWR